MVRASRGSIVPGGGQLYAGEVANGLVRLLIAVGAAAAVLVPLGVAWQRREDLTWQRDWSLLLSGFYVVPHGEGWGLYAERLADELGLYSDDVQRLGMLGSAAFCSQCCARS